MDPTEISTPEAMMQAPLAKMDAMTEKLDASVARLNEATDKINAASTQLIKAMAENRRGRGSLLWLWTLLFVAAVVAALYFFVPSSGIQAIIDGTSMPDSSVSTQSGGATGPAPNATNTFPAYPPHPPYPPYPLYPPYPPMPNDYKAFATPQQTNPSPPWDQGADPANTPETLAPEKSEPAKLNQPAKPQKPAKPSRPEKNGNKPTPPASAAKPPYEQEPVRPTPPTAPPQTAKPGSSRTNSDIAQARQAVTERNYKVAIKAYERFLQQNPGNIDGWGELGNVQLLAGQQQHSAQSYYEAATRLIDQGRIGEVYSLMPIISQNEPQLASILQQKMARRGN